MSKKLTKLLSEVRACELCRDSLPLGPRPVVVCRSSAQLLIVGQAPGTRVHKSGVPWDDPSGDRLRDWMGVSQEIFYQHPSIAIMPMGFCYPGKGKSGDLPPRKECAPQWHRPLLDQMPKIELTLVIGQYAQTHYLPRTERKGVTQVVQYWGAYLPRLFPLPHPSPRNNIWLRKNPWFYAEAVPALREEVGRILAT